ncbi:hypothetical protein CBS115989_10417 [Aspergillus niger]|nr:hypothetical protein CBS115989_10417 [Aspergillus niger]KAI2826567.1 hypothetical protein CBS133816_7304 [Aspergillus niger]KAI2837998.1 hypothetical protein CBS11350_8390 [Aspergillus niger]KAI2839514.1 hypothetical protein CBS11232_9359 [Aspergillus niger]KAI2855054.1 hypothetical protein CBS12448_7434 [Aspergillus niger]
MSASTFPDASLARDTQSSDFDLIVRQQPNRARVAGGKEKERKPVDPPPIVQIRVREEGTYLAQHYLQSPYYFMCCSLYDASEDNPVPVAPSTALTGTLVSSLHRLKDVDNTDGGFFVWGDLSVKIEGDFRLKFTLFEMRKDVVTHLKSIITDRFTVYPPKSFPGMAESTFLSRSFADQGVKLRIRKEPRTLIKRPVPRPEEYPQPIPRSPDRSSIQMPSNAFSAYPTTSRDYGYYGQQTHPNGRMRQMDTYPQTAIYNQPGGYATPMMQGYPAGHTAVPDYAMSYGIPSSTQVPQMQDPGAHGRSSQQATMQSLGMVNAPGTPTADSTGAMMPQSYPRSQYQTGSTILPPLQQRNRNFAQGTNGAAARGYFDQSSQAATPILPSQPIPTNEVDRRKPSSTSAPGFSRGFKFGHSKYLERTQTKGVNSAFEVKDIASSMKLEASDAGATFESSLAHSDTGKEPVHDPEQPEVAGSVFGEADPCFSLIDEMTPLPEPSNEDTTKVSGEVRKDPFWKWSNADSTPSIPALKESPLSNSDPGEVPMVAEIEPEEIAKARLLPKLTIPQPSHGKTADDKETSPQSHDDESRADVHCEPVFDINRGILIVKNPSNVQPEHYKLIVTISVSLRQRKQSGWNDLVIQGLPKLVPGEYGYLLFLMPEEYGLEFRTTNLQRHKIVENCFLGEFSYTGDLVIPVRRCERKFYGVVKDFTVHQEIRAEYALASVKVESPPELQATYHAVCSVRLHNRCFWAETCCLILSIDGGPDSVFRSKLDSQESGLKMIHIPARENVGIGSAYLQIVCSPRDLELFCVNWTVRLPGHHAISWLPRIYPAFSSPSDRVRHHLRRTFEKVEAVSLSRIERSRGYEMGEPEIDDSKEPAGIRDAIAIVADLPATDKQPMNNSANIPRSENVIQKMRLVFICAIYVLGTILAFWLNNTVIDAVASPTKATSTVANMDAESLNMSQPTAVHWHSYTSQPDRSWEGNSKDEPTPGVSISVEANEEVTMDTETTKPDQESTRSAPAGPRSLESPQAEQELTFRDRVDYWLGWRGPANSEIHGETVAQS